MIFILFILCLLAGVLVIALILRAKHASSPSLEEELAKEFIAHVAQQNVQRRHSNWAPAVSKRRRREARKIREQNYVDWQKMKLQCQLHGLNYNRFVSYAKKLASKYGIKLN